MTKPLRFSILCGLLALLSRPGNAAGDAQAIALAADPAAVGHLREMNTDRPDATESPFTVDAGHVQIEADFLSDTRNHLDGVRSREWNYATTNVRWGVSPSTELGIFVSPWVRRNERDRATMAEQSISGIGDTVIRGKLNLGGNDGGESAGGLIVDLKLPTAADGIGNDAVEGALIFPYSRQLPGGWELGAMLAIDVRRDEIGSGYTPILRTTASVGHYVTEKVGVYFELTSETGGGPRVTTFNTGLTFALDDNMQVDCGLNAGISRAADDAQLFAGVAHRF